MEEKEAVGLHISECDHFKKLVKHRWQGEEGRGLSGNESQHPFPKDAWRDEAEWSGSGTQQSCSRCSPKVTTRQVRKTRA